MANRALLVVVPLIPAAGIAVFIMSAVRKGQIDVTLLHGFGVTVSCYRARTPGNFWLFIGMAGFVAIVFVALAGFFAWLITN